MKIFRMKTKNASTNPQNYKYHNFIAQNLPKNPLTCSIQENNFGSGSRVPGTSL